MLFPTSTIIKFNPIFHAAFSVFLKALWFYWRSVRRRPKRLKEYSSISFDLATFAMTISSSSSLVSCSFWRQSTTSCSIDLHCAGYYLNQLGWVSQEKALKGRVKGEKARILREKGSYRGKRKFSYQFHNWLEYRMNVISTGAYYLLEVFHYFAPSYTNQFTSIKQLSNLISSFPTQKMVILVDFREDWK